MIKLSSYKNRVVVVTGGNGNLGRAILKKFKSYGAKCFAVDLKGSSNVIKCNLTNEKAVNDLVNLMRDLI